MTVDDEAAQLKYAQALSDWAEARGYEAETLWDMCTTAALGVPYEKAQWRQVRTLSGGEQKRLVLEALLRGTDEVLLLDEPDNYLDVPGKRWLEERLQGDPQDGPVRLPRPRAARPRPPRRSSAWSRAPAGADAWVHGGGFATYHEARQRALRALRGAAPALGREARPAEEARPACSGRRPRSATSMASRYQAAQTRLRKFEEAGPPPEPPREQDITMRLQRRPHRRAGRHLQGPGADRPDEARSTWRSSTASGSPSSAPTAPASRTSCGCWPAATVAHTGAWKLGARVVPGHFAQTHAHPELQGRPLLDILWKEHAQDRGAAMSRLRRYELTGQAEQTFDRLSGGQQARFQILLLELAGRRPRCCSTSRPTTSTWSPPRRCRRAWRRSTGRCSRSRTTAGSPAPSTATWSSAATAGCGRPPSRCGTSAGWSGRGRRVRGGRRPPGPCGERGRFDPRRPRHRYSAPVR